MQTSDANNFFRTETDLASGEARKRKAERTKHLGAPIDLPGKPLALQLCGNDLWLSQSDASVRRLDLEVDRAYWPVTTIALLDESDDGTKAPLLVSGSWDKNKALISSTNAHSDFVKCVLPVPKLKLLITGGSDKVVRFWDVSDARDAKPLPNIGLIAAHTRPVQCLAVDVHSASAATLYTADSMGVINVWALERTYGDAKASACLATQTGELSVHRTGVNDMWYGQGQLWTASSDDTALLTVHPAPTNMSQPFNTNTKTAPPLTHPTAVKALLPLSLSPLDEPLLLTGAGDVMRLYDISAPREPELLSTTDAHWMDISGLGLWLKKVEKDGKDWRRAMGGEREFGRDGEAVEACWCVFFYFFSSFLLAIKYRYLKKLLISVDLINPLKEPPKEPEKEETKPASESTAQLTAEEEAELAELMGDDD
ncbi:WD40 repeat-like protein [Phellopilus nigrolimitatus]|nr:WD40 repeat-like protein [Phellopilus nigrolimitatus]